MFCEVACGNPDACWSVEPHVEPTNRAAWTLYQLFETQWEWGFSGYRIRYDYMALLALAAHLDGEPADILDLTEKVRVIEHTLLTIEEERYEHDKKSRERKTGESGTAS